MLPLKKYLAAAFVSVTAISAGLLAAPAPNKWLSTVTVTAKGAHVLGNPAAPKKVVEYLSYTCGHCADFEANESPAFKAAERASFLETISSSYPRNLYGLAKPKISVQPHKQN
jgi:protein-disulfide isomerase